MMAPAARPEARSRDAEQAGWSSCSLLADPAEHARRLVLINALVAAAGR
jgi:hypothetical protein